MTNLTDLIETQTSMGLCNGMIMFDLQKAFDTVEHALLSDKLGEIGVESVSWFRSFLAERNHFIQVNDTQSDSSLITLGVPQGSSLATSRSVLCK